MCCLIKNDWSYIIFVVKFLKTLIPLTCPTLSLVTVAIVVVVAGGVTVCVALETCCFVCAFNGFLVLIQMEPAVGLSARTVHTFAQQS